METAPPFPGRECLSAAEVHAIADTDPLALRMLLSPDYDGIASSFARLLLKVVQRCKRVGQVGRKATRTTLLLMLAARTHTDHLLSPLSICGDEEMSCATS